MRQEISTWSRRGARCIAALVFGVIYVLLSHHGNEMFFPRAGILAETLGSALRGSELWIDIAASTLRVTAGFLLAAAVGVPLGVIVGSFRLVEAAIQAPTEFMRYVPVPALVPLVMIFVGIGELAKITLICVGTLFQLTIMVADEIRRAPHELIQIAQTMGAQRDEVVTRVLFRAALPGIFDSLRVCNGWAWTYVVVAELVAATEGLGYRTLRLYRYVQTPQIYVYLLVLGTIGLVMDAMFRRVNIRLFPWVETSRR